MSDRHLGLAGFRHYNDVERCYSKTKKSEPFLQLLEQTGLTYTIPIKDIISDQIFYMFFYA